MSCVCALSKVKFLQSLTCQSELVMMFWVKPCMSGHAMILVMSSDAENSLKRSM